MKPINCTLCGYFEKVSGLKDVKDSYICMRSYRMLENPEKGRDEECPLDERPKDNADKKGFYLIKDEDGPVE